MYPLVNTACWFPLLWFACVTMGGPAEGEWWLSDHFGVLLNLARLPRPAAAGDGLSNRDRALMRLQAEYELLSY